MAVIALPNVSPQGPSPVMEWGSKTFNEEFESPFTGQNQTYGNGANVARQSARLTFENLHRLTTAPVLKRFLVQCRGKANSFFVPDYSHTLRGSFPATELLTNNHFASGTTGWTGHSAQYTLSAADGQLTSTRNASGTDLYFALRSGVPIVQYAPYAARFLIHQGRGNYSTGFRIDTTDTVGSTTTSFGLLTLSEVVRQAATTTVAIMDRTAGLVAGDYLLTSFASYARCALVDNGTNSFLQSDTLQTTWATTEATVTPNAITAPDGTTTADNISDNANNVDHYIGQAVTIPAAAADYSYFGSFRGSGITWVQCRMSTATGDVRVWINLTNGAIATTTTGSGWSNTRVFVTAQGDSWYRVHLVSHKTSADTTLTSYVRLATGDGVTAYAGVGGGLNAWRVGVSPSGVPSRGAQTTTTASSGTSQTGASLYLKGLPASTSGLLLAGDPAEIILPSGSQFVRTTAALNSDAAGLGYWQFEPPLRSSPADGAAVIVCRPLMRAHLADSTVRWTERLAGFMDCEFSCIEDMV